MKTKGILLVFLTSIFLSGPAVSTFGVSSFQTEADLNDTREFRIGLINTGGSSLRVNFSSRNASSGSLDLDSREILLEPSETGTSPQGSGWYYLDGRYVEIRYWSFSYMPEDMGGVDRFELRVQATPVNSSGPTYGPTISQVRDIEYNLNLTGGDDASGSVWGSGNYGEPRDPGEDRVEDQRAPETGESSEPVNDSINQSGDSAEERSDQGSVNKVTLILLATTLFTALYILNEV